MVFALPRGEASCRLILTCLQVTLLFNDTRVFPPVVLASEERRHRLTSLTPGRLYKIVVSTFSGLYQRAQFIEGRTGETIQQLSATLSLESSCAERGLSSAVPGAVGNLHLAPWPGLTDSAGGLLVSWTPGDGDLDMYIVTLSATVSPAA